jgi:hypothetical protein
LVVVLVADAVLAIGSINRLSERAALLADTTNQLALRMRSTADYSGARGSATAAQ